MKKAGTHHQWAYLSLCQRALGQGDAFESSRLQTAGSKQKVMTRRHGISKPLFFSLCQGDKGNQIRLFTPGSLSSPNLARVPGNDLLSHYPDTFRILIARHASGLLYPRWTEKSTLMFLALSLCLFFLFASSLFMYVSVQSPYSVVLLDNKQKCIL